MLTQSRVLTQFGKWIEEKQFVAFPRITDVELSRRVGISRQQINKIKRGVSGTKRDVIILIAQALNGDTEEALRLAFGVAPKQVGICDIAEEIAGYLIRMELKDRERAREIVKTLATY